MPVPKDFVYEAIEAIERQRQYDVLVEANRNLISQKSWSEWIELIWQTQDPAYEFLRNSYDKFDKIKKEYYEKTVTASDTFYNFEKEKNALITRFLDTYKVSDELGPNIFNQASAFQWFVDELIRKSPSYIEFIRAKLFNDKKEVIFNRENPKLIYSFSDREEARAHYKGIKQTLNIIDSLKQLVTDLDHGHCSTIKLKAVISNIESEYYVTESFRRNFKKPILREISNLLPMFVNENINQAAIDIFKHYIKQSTQSLRSELNEELKVKSKLTLEQFEKLTVSDVQRLFIAAASEDEWAGTDGDKFKKTKNILGLTLEVINDFGINYIGENWMEAILTQDQQGVSLQEFSQVEFETRLDFIKQGHCLSYSFLYAVYTMLGEINEAMRKFSEMKSLLTLGDFDTFLRPPAPKVKDKIDKYRHVINAFYDEYYKDTSELNQVINEMRPKDNKKNEVWLLSDILRELSNTGSEKARSVVIRTGNHALAISFSSVSGKYQFFDPNVGIIQYATNELAEARLTDFFTQLMQGYSVATDDQRRIYLNADFINEKLAKKITLLRGIEIAKPSDIVIAEENEATVCHVLEADHYAQTLQRELPEMMQRASLDHNWVPNYNAVTESAEGVWKLPFVKNIVVKEIQIKSKRLQRALAFLKKQGEKLNRAFSLENEQLQIKSGISEETRISGMEGLSLLGAIQMVIGSTKSQKLGNTLAVGLDIFAWANVALNVGQTTVDVIHTGLVMVGREGSLIKKTLSSVSKGLNSLGLISGGVSVGLDAYELDQAIVSSNSVAIGTAATSLSFDSLSLGLGAVGFVAGETVATFAGSLMVPVAGLAIGFTALIKSFLGNLEKALAAIKFLGEHIYNAYDVGGYKKNDEGILIPQYAVISRLDFNSGTLTFGETLLHKNTWSFLGSPTSVEGYLDMCVGFGFNKTASLDKTAEMIVLPQTGNVKLEWEIAETSTAFDYRHDSGVDSLKALYYRTGKQFTFYNGFWTIYNIHQKYYDTTVEIMLDKIQRQFIMPPPDFYPNTGEYFYPHLTWNMHYVFEGNGGNYALTVNNKPKGEAWVTINENKDTTSTWMIHAGDSVNDNIADLRATSQWGPYFRIGGVFIAVQNPKQTKILVAKNNGELWQCDVIAEKAIFVGISALKWQKSNSTAHISLIDGEAWFNALEQLVQDRKVEQMVIASAWTSKSKSEIPKNLNGIYSSKTKQIQFEDEDGIIYSTKSSVMEHILKLDKPNILAFVIKVRGVNAMAWLTKNPGGNLFDILKTLAEKTQRHIINVLCLQNESNQHPLSGQYFKNTGLLFAVSENGKMYELKPDYPTTLVAITPVWFKEQAKIISARNSTALTVTLQEQLQEQKTWVTELQILLSNEPSVTSILPLHGLKSKLAINQTEGSVLSAWYDVKNKQFIVAGGLINQTLEYVAQGNDFAWLFNQKQGNIYIQPFAGDGTQYLFDFAPSAIQPFPKLGKLVSAKQLENGWLRVNNVNDMTFELRSPFEALLVRTGKQCKLSWNDIWNQVKEKHYKIAEIVYTYDAENFDYPHGDHYWYHTPSKTKFHPLEKKMVDNGNIDDYKYIGYSTVKRGIYLFDNSQQVLKFQGFGANSYELIVQNIMRSDNILAMAGVQQSRSNGENYMLPEIDGIKTLILNMSPEERLVGVNWFNNISYSRVIFDNFDDGIPFANGTDLAILLEDVTLNNFKNNFKTQRKGIDLELIDGNKAIVFRNFTSEFYSEWTLAIVSASDSLSVKLVDLEHELKQKIDQSLTGIRKKRSNTQFSANQNTDRITEIAHSYLDKYENHEDGKKYAEQRSFKKINKHSVADNTKWKLACKAYTNQRPVSLIAIKNSNNHTKSEANFPKQINHVKKMLAHNDRSNKHRFIAKRHTPMLSATDRNVLMLADKNFKKPFISENSVRPRITHKDSGFNKNQTTPSQVTAHIDVSSTLFAMNVLARVANRGQYKPEFSSAGTAKYNKMQRQTEKIKAKVFGKPRLERIETKAQGFNLK